MSVGYWICKHNKRVISVRYGMCYRTQRSVGYCGMTATELRSVEVWYREPEVNLCGVSDVLQNLTEE